jgi:hypothetical protein
VGTSSRSATRQSSLKRKQKTAKNLLKEARSLYNKGKTSQAYSKYEKSASIYLGISKSEKNLKSSINWLNSYISITREMASKLEKEDNIFKRRKAIKVYNEIYINYNRYNEKYSRKKGFVRNKGIERSVSDCLARVVCLGIRIKEKSDIRKAKDAYKILKKEFPQSAGIKKAEKAKQEYKQYLENRKSNKS